MIIWFSKKANINYGDESLNKYKVLEEMLVSAWGSKNGGF